MFSLLFREKHSRSITKAITFRLIVILSDMIVIFFITRQAATTLEVIFVSNVSSTLIYYFHERGWNRIKWGKGALS
jgi:uncharacterized membrane protein